MTIRSPSDPTREQLIALREVLRPRGLLRIRGNPEPVLAGLVASKDPGALRDLVGIALEQDGDSHCACVTAVHALAKPLLPNRLPELDEWLRRSRPWAGHWEDGWQRLRPGDIARLSLADSAALTLVGLCASHPNGHVREAAVRRLAAARSGAELGFLLLRANDWVPGIRLRARTASLDRITPVNASTLLRHLRLVDRLAQASRADQTLVAAVDAALKTESARSVLLEGLRALDVHVRRHCFPLVATAVGGTPAWLLDAACEDRDVVVRRWTYDRALEIPDEKERERYLERAVLDSFAPIRRVALAYWSRRAGSAADRLCEVMLFDHTAGLRADAQHTWLARRGSPVVERYRQEMKAAQSGQLVGALGGLAETGGSADADLARPYLTHSRARVRRAALRALCRLAPDADASPFESALLGDTRVVAAEAARCLHSRGTLLDPTGLWAAATTRPAYVRVRVLPVFRSLGKWRHLEFILSGAIDPEAAVRDVALRELETWLDCFNRSFTAPTDGERAALQGFLARARPALPAAVSREIDFVVRVT